LVIKWPLANNEKETNKNRQETDKNGTMNGERRHYKLTNINSWFISGERVFL
jgi:hypothetical protein